MLSMAVLGIVVGYRPVTYFRVRHTCTWNLHISMFYVYFGGSDGGAW